MTLGDIFRGVIRVCWKASRAVAVVIAWRVAGLFLHLQNVLTDLRLGISACALSDQRQDGKAGDGRGYAPASYWRLNRMLRHLDPQPADVFLDLGCGRGRVVCRAAMENFKEVRGVDVDPPMVDAARRNADRMRGRRSAIKIIQEDVADTDVSDVTVFFMFLPFGWKTLQQVLDNIEQSLVVNPRRIRIFYLSGDEYYVLLDMRHWLKRKGEIGITDIHEWEHRPELATAPNAG